MSDDLTLVDIPGSFTAEYRNGDIVRMVFTPALAGADVIEGDDALDVEDVDGPFWRAMQAALAPTTFVAVGGLEDDDNFDSHGDRTTVAIEWEE